MASILNTIFIKFYTRHLFSLVPIYFSFFNFKLRYLNDRFNYKLKPHKSITNKYNNIGIEIHEGKFYEYLQYYQPN